MNEKLEALNQEIEKTEKKLQRAQHEEKMLEHQIKTLTRKERTHRLSSMAALVQSRCVRSFRVSVFIWCSNIFSSCCALRSFFSVFSIS